MALHRSWPAVVLLALLVVCNLLSHVHASRSSSSSSTTTPVVADSWNAWPSQTSIIADVRVSVGHDGRVHMVALNDLPVRFIGNLNIRYRC
jgi:hypothetical protein